MNSPSRTLGLTLMIVAVSSQARASSYTTGQKSDCCGGMHVFKDCQARPHGVPGCTIGTAWDHNEEDSGVWHDLSCLNVGCIDDIPKGCVPDVPDGQSIGCVKGVRSCGGLVGQATCGETGGSVPSNVCFVPHEDDMDFCPKFACLGGIIDNTDTDGDGLLDCWETQGIDTDADGVVDFDLPSFGVSQLRSDVLVEYDYFDCKAGGDCAAGDVHSHAPIQSTADAIGSIDAVKNAFSRAPVTNPDGSSGINLIVQAGEAIAHRQNCAFDSSCFGSLKAVWFGTPEERNNPKALLAKRIVFRYNIWAHDQAAGDANSGVANVAGPNFMVSLGSGWTNSVGEQSGAFMHELGHTLGLGHGGQDAINFKPNYFSVMNYRWQSSGLIPGAILDYSRSALPTLHETALDESVGIPNARYTTVFYCPNQTTQQGLGGGPINWDCGLPPDAADGTGLSLDINNDRICVTPGANGRLDSAVGGIVLSGDDVVGGGSVQPGADGILQTVPAVGSDDVRVGDSIVPGRDGILQSLPAADVDDVLKGAQIWDGPNRTCDSRAVGDDRQDRAVGSVQPADLSGAEDWHNLTFDFSGAVAAWQAGAALLETLPSTEASRVKTENTSADLGITQTASQAPDGTITYRVTIANQGPDSALAPTFNDRLPTTLTVASCATDDGTPCHVQSGYVSASAKNLGLGRTLGIRMTAHLTGVPSAAAAHTVSVEASSPDHNRANNVSSICLLPPQFTSAPADLCGAEAGSRTLGTAPQATSPCGLTVKLTHDAPPVLPEGRTTVTWTATDEQGNTTTAVQQITAFSPIEMLLGFEDASLFSSQEARLATASSSRTQGCGGLAIRGSHYMMIQGSTFRTREIASITPHATVDLYIPNGQPQPSWLGALQLYVSCPSLGLNNGYIGQVELTGKPWGQFSTLKFSIPSSIQSTLRRNASDCRFGFALNVNPTGQDWILDNLQLVP